MHGPLKIDLNGSTQQAAFHGSQPNSSGPAIISNAYGTGHALAFAFDLATSLRAVTNWQPILGAGLQVVLPAQSTTLTPDGLLSVKTRIANQAKATDVDVKSILPVGASYLSANPSAAYEAATRTVNWAFNLATAQTKDLSLLMEAPANAGDFSLQTIVSSVKNGTTTPYGTPITLAFHVTSAQQSAATAQAELTAFVLTANKDQKLRDSLVTQLQRVMTSLTQNTATGDEAAIGALIQIIDQLSGLKTVDTRAVHDAPDHP